MHCRGCWKYHLEEDTKMYDKMKANKNSRPRHMLNIGTKPACYFEGLCWYNCILCNLMTMTKVNWMPSTKMSCLECLTWCLSFPAKPDHAWCHFACGPLVVVDELQKSLHVDNRVCFATPVWHRGTERPVVEGISTPTLMGGLYSERFAPGCMEKLWDTASLWSCQHELKWNVVFLCRVVVPMLLVWYLEYSGTIFLPAKNLRPLRTPLKKMYHCQRCDSLIRWCHQSVHSTCTKLLSTHEWAKIDVRIHVLTIWSACT